MKREIEFASHPGNLALVRNFVREFLESIALPECEKNLIVLGLDEACTNVIRHAYDHQPDRLMHLTCEMAEDGVVFRLRDFGTQPDPTKIEGRPLELVQPGGLGVHLIRRAFDRIDYRLMKEGTELVLARSFVAGES